MTFSADPLHVTTLLTDLVSTNSVNPTLVEGAPGEAEIADLATRRMREAGLEVTRYEPEAGRPSVVGRLTGIGGGPALMLNAHYDTVGVEGMEAPFSPRIRDGRLYGRGAYDMKGSLAACIEAVRLLGATGVRLAGDVIVAAVADEEYASLGTTDLLERRARGELAFDAAIVTEPTSLELCVAHRGFMWIEIATRGRAAHGSRYRDGIDANLRMGRVLHRLEGLIEALQSRPGHHLLGPPSMHAARLEGGSGISTYSPRCTLQVERRTVPPETRASVEGEIAALIGELRAEDPDLEIDWSTFFHREPFETTPEAPIAACVSRAARQVLGRAPAVIGDAPWMDSALTQAAGVDSVVIGPHGKGAHSDVEWVDIASCLRLAEILAGAAADYCG